MSIAESNLSHPKYRPDIDGLRAVAVLSVVAFHAFPPWMRGGFIGVDIFFVISGFLISTIIFENLDKGTFSFVEFYARRIRRIFPALILILVSCLAVGWLILIPEELNQLGKHVAAGAGFLSNFILWAEAGYFDNSAETKPLLHLWSLGIEEQFYIVWPLLVWCAWKRNVNLLTLALMVAVISFYLNLTEISSDPVGTFYSPQTRFWELVCGSTLAWLTLYKSPFRTHIWMTIDGLLAKAAYRSTVVTDGRTLSNFVSALGIAILMYGFWQTNKDVGFPGKWALIPVAGAVLVILAGPQAWINRRFLSARVVVWFGLISFPLYLWHWPLLSFARIVENEIPSRGIRVAAVLLSILLAWLTVKLVERPFRFGHQRASFKAIALMGIMAIVGGLGFQISKSDFTDSHGYEKLLVKRKGFEHAFGSSLTWFRGKDGWLYLGNAHDEAVAKIKMAIEPDPARVNSILGLYSNAAKAASSHKVPTVLIVGPDKSSVYPEYLPDGLVPSPVRYSSFFLSKLEEIPDLVVYDPTMDLIKSKATEGILYWKTDTHWNRKGAFLTYAGFSKRLGLPIPKATFSPGQARQGDLIEIAKLKDFPANGEDNWEVVLPASTSLKVVEIPNEKRTSFGAATIVTNGEHLSDKYVWVIGDSFAEGLKPYFNATFKEVHYLGHWNDKVKELPELFSKAQRLPDLVVIVRVERTF